MVYDRGAVVKGPDLFTDHDYRPYVCLSDNTDFETGGLPRETYVNPWTVVSIRHADIDAQEGRLVEPTIETIALEAAGYLGVS